LRGDPERAGQDLAQAPALIEQRGAARIGVLGLGPAQRTMVKLRVGIDPDGSYGGDAIHPVAEEYADWHAAGESPAINSGGAPGFYGEMHGLQAEPGGKEEFYGRRLARQAPVAM